MIGEVPLRLWCGGDDGVENARSEDEADAEGPGVRGRVDRGFQGV